MTRIIRFLSAPADPKIQVITPPGRKPRGIYTMPYRKSEHGGPWHLQAHTEDMDVRRKYTPEAIEEDEMTKPPVVEGVPDLGNTQEDRKKWERARRNDT